VGGFSGKVAKVIAGGPMMGITQKDLEAPVIKGTSGILVLDDKTARPAEDSPCMRCGKCVDACPMGLEPYLLNVLSEAGDFDAADASHARDCIECGCCSYTCPANRYLVHSIRLAKTEINNRCKIAK